MIRDLFNADRPAFVRFQDDCFIIGKQRREQLRGVITDMIPMRKRFEQDRIVCYSNDGITGKHRQRCALCRQRWTCAERLRLMMLLDGLEHDRVPAILEIGHGSFEAFDAFLHDLGTQPLAEVTILVSIERNEERMRFTFQKAP
jgi:hypothetical protein